MTTFEIVAVILLIVFGARFLRDRGRQEGAERLPTRPDDDTRQLIEEVARLRERVQVLERVVTDNHGSGDLERRIEALRHGQGDR